MIFSQRKNRIYQISHNQMSRMILNLPLNTFFCTKFDVFYSDSFDEHKKLKKNLHFAADSRNTSANINATHCMAINTKQHTDTHTRTPMCEAKFELSVCRQYMELTVERFSNSLIVVCWCELTAIENFEKLFLEIFQ